jgi:hypothetical protein
LNSRQYTHQVVVVLFGDAKDVVVKVNVAILFRLILATIIVVLLLLVGHDELPLVNVDEGVMIMVVRTP